MPVKMGDLFNSSQIKPVLKWAGGKRELLPEIRKFYEHLAPVKYIEPFFGGGAVYFDILRTFGESIKETAIINDINSDLISLYRNIKSDPDSVVLRCRELEGEYHSQGYYHVRDRFNGITKEKVSVERYEGVTRSAALILLNRTCFNGLYRVNKKGFFNVPKGNYKNPRILDETNLYLLSEALPRIENIRNSQFDEIPEVAAGDLVYFDPPYHPLTETSSFTAYSGEFGNPEQIRLRNHFKELSDKGVHVILSNSSAQFIREIYADFSITEVYCSRNINSRSAKRGKIPEFLILGDTFK